MHKWLLITLIFSLNSYAEIGEISELRGNGEVLRKDQSDKLLAETALGIFSYDDVRTGNGRIGITFLDSTIIRLTEHSKIIIDEYIYDPDPSKSKMALKMASGTARFITGALGKIDKQNIKIRGQVVKFHRFQLYVPMCDIQTYAHTEISYFILD